MRLSGAIVYDVRQQGRITKIESESETSYPGDVPTESPTIRLFTHKYLLWSTIEKFRFVIFLMPFISMAHFT